MSISRSILPVVACFLLSQAIDADPLFPTPAFDSGTDHVSMAVGDFNNDGHLDTVTTSFQNERVAVLLGNGDATFGPQAQFIVGNRPRGVAVGDFNDDGDLDIVCVGWTEQNVAVLLGKGDGDFEVRKLFFLGETPDHLAVADFNRDGHLDIIATTRSQFLFFLAGRGDGYFATPAPIDVGGTYGGIRAGDLDDDGRVDLAAIRGGDVYIHRGKGDGSFEDATLYDLGRPRWFIHLADLDGNDALDVVTVGYDATASILFGNGDGTFVSGGEVLVGDRARSLATGDVDRDGHVDLVAALEPLDQVSVILGDGQGGFQPPLFRDSPRGPYSVHVTDLDGDGMTDIVVGSFDEVGVFLGLAGGRFEDNDKVEVGDRPFDVEVADLNGDGNADFVTVNAGSYDFSVVLGTGAGEFAPAQRIEARSIKDVELADFNADGAPDLVAVSDSYRQVAIYIGRGDGTFGPPEAYPVGGRAVKVEIEDVDGDGTLDLVVDNRSSSFDTSLLLGNGDGTFAPEFRLDELDGFLFGDFNEDGIPDLVKGGVRISFRYGLGGGTFGADQVMLLSGLVMAVDDFDEDGSQDVLLDRGILLGRGDGSFEYELFDERLPRWRPQIADLDGDGVRDLIYEDWRRFRVHLGLDDTRFGPPTNYLIATCGSRFTVGDLDGNGSTDIAAINSCEDTVAIVLNRRVTERAVAIDVNPGVDPNLVHLRSRGVTRVAVLGAEGSDVRDIDPAALRLGAKGAAPLAAGEVTDVNADGRRDLVVPFRTSEIGLACGDTSVELSGSLRSGQAIRGADSIVTVGCGGLSRDRGGFDVQPR